MMALARQRELSLLMVMVLLSGIVFVNAPQFLSASNLSQVVILAAIIAIAATGEALVVVTRNVDLSVGSTLGIAAFAAGDYLQGGGQPVVAVLLAVAIGAGFGLLNGGLVSFGKVPSLVVTLGTLYIIRGIDSIWVHSKEIVAADLPRGFVVFGHGGPFFLPYLALLGLLVLLALGFFLRSYRSGREFYALGSNPEAARLAGIRVRRRIVAAYLLCGAIAGLAGALYLARFGNVDANTGSGFELTVVSAVVVGGVAFTGGSGSVYGAALGALLLTTIAGALPSLRVDSSWVAAIDGVLLLAAIGTDRVIAVRVAALLRRRNVRRG
jgi:rhamnose transport system permease protein